MNRLFCFVLAVTLAGICACQRQEKDTPKPALIENPQAKEKDTPKPPEPYTNSLGMKFVWIPSGNFVMGSP